MREIADYLLVFLLNLVASTGGVEPPARTMTPPEETSRVAPMAAMVPICESAPVLISAPVPHESELKMIAQLEHEIVMKDFQALALKKAHKRIRVIPRIQEPL